MVGVKSIEQALHVNPAISSEMVEAIQRWTDLYEDKAPWLHEPSYKDPTKVVSLGLPAFIASEKARMAVLEMKVEINAPTETQTIENPNYKNPTIDEFGNMVVSGEPKTITEEKIIGPTERADFLNEQFKKVLVKIRQQLEFGIAKGGLVIKPYIVLNKLNDDEDSEENLTKATIEFDYIQADGFFPISFDGSGKVTEAAFIQPKVEKNIIYRRLEYHKLEGNKVTVINKAYKSTNTNINGDAMNEVDLGVEIKLSEVPEWKDLQEKITIKNVDRLLFAYYRMPEANTIDTHSPLGVSGFARAEKLIREADLQYSRLLWEFEGGELAIDIDRDALQFVESPEGEHSVMSNLQRRLYRKVDLGESNTYQQFSPALRDSSLVNGLNTILMRIEDVCSLSRGTISEVAAEARTATELKILKQRSYSANAEIQKELENTLKDVIYIMDVYTTLYNVVGDAPVNAFGEIDTANIGRYEASFEWDDSILVDVDQELNKRIILMQNGLTSKLENRMWYFGETENQAREALAKIEQESREAMENNIMLQQGNNNFAQ